MIDTWIPHPAVLKGELVDLLPLEKIHFEELRAAASDAKLWQHIPLNCSKQETFDVAYNAALDEREKGNQYPFVIYHKQTKQLIGSTRFLDIVQRDKKLEIGWTWLIEKYWGTSINPECKLLLLTYSFEVLQARRVQIKTDENNTRSRKAIEKIGGHFEGILRKDRIRENGTSRNSAYYSIIDDEWRTTKVHLSKLVEERRNTMGR